ncbi:MAG: asparagine synthetase B family protein [Phycisphaeraceae bacterium]|nr:MAG: asparagine synthetase B family protein [Phycisphaeraceae bacterium]
MSGWITVWSLTGAPPDAERWAASVRLAQRHGESLSEATGLAGGAAAIAAWRREMGEFPHAGKIHDRPGGARVAWLGQCLEDDGDASEEAMRVLENPGRLDEDAIAKLNGPFSAVIVHESPARAAIVLDRHRHLPVYIVRRADAVVASTDMRALTPWLDNPALSAQAVDLFLRCGELIDGLTLLEDVEMLPGAAVVRMEGGDVARTRHWTMRHEPDERKSFNELADALGERLRGAVRRVERAMDRVGITLSGGLDSRFLLGMCERPQDVPSFTWGLPRCRDITCAADFARRIGSPHMVKHWTPEDFPPLWERGVEATAGSIGVDIMYMLPFANLLGEHCDVILNGLAGDALLGGNFLKRAWLRESDMNSLAQASWRWRVRGVDDEVADLLTPGKGAGRSMWIESIGREGCERPILRLNDWLYENRVFRNTNCGTMLQRRRVESHAPFFDRDFLDLVLRAPLEMRLRHRLYLAAMNRACSEAGRSPWQRTGLPPRWGLHANLASMAFHRAWRKAMGAAGREAFPRLKVADAGAWMRGAWRECIEAVILSERALDRGATAPDGVREVWRRHLVGEEFTRTIGALVTIELLARTMVDTVKMPTLVEQA